jgi:putative tricarboxylic transport membrane protein
MATDARLTKALPYAIVGAAAGYLYYAAAHFQYHARAGTLGPDFWPQAILVLTIVVCLYEVIKIAFRGAHTHDVVGALEDMVEESADKHAAAEPDAAPVESHPVLLLLGIGVTLLYVVAVQKLGFFLATVTYLIVFMLIGGYRRWGVIAAVSLIGTLLLLFIFMRLVYVSLPIGEEPFAQVTLLLMQLMGIR